MTAAFWNNIADRYAARPVDNPAAYEATLDAVSGYLTPDAQVLEQGCGTGSTALRLAPHCARYVACDISDRMIAIARSRDGAEGVDFRVAAALDPQPDAPFDVVCAFNLIHLLPDTQAAANALAAQLRPGGLLITKTPCVGEMFPGIRLVLPLMRLLGKAPPVTFFRRDALETAIRRAGMEVVEHRHFLDARLGRFIVARKL